MGREGRGALMTPVSNRAQRYTSPGVALAWALASAPIIDVWQRSRTKSGTRRARRHCLSTRATVWHPKCAVIIPARGRDVVLCVWAAAAADCNIINGHAGSECVHMECKVPATVHD